MKLTTSHHLRTQSPQTNQNKLHILEQNDDVTCTDEAHIHKASNVTAALTRYLKKCGRMRSKFIRAATRTEATIAQ